MRIRQALPILILLLTPITVTAAEEKAPTAKVYGFPATEVIALLEDVDANQQEAKIKAALATIATKPSSLRFVNSQAKDLVRVYSFYRDDGKKPVLRFDEKQRQLLIADQFRTLIKLADSLPAAVTQKIVVEAADYELKLRRATLKVTASLAADGEPATTDPARKPQWIVVVDFTNGGEPKNAERAAADILTGPREPWSLSADVPVTSIGDVKVDDKAENIELADTPGTFYVGLNFAPFGDALRLPGGFAEALTVKALLKASRRPSDSFGIGVGLRPGLFANSSLLQIFDTLSPYISYTRSRVEEEKENADGTTEKIHFKRNEFSIGISLDLESALGFVKKAGSDAKE
jgi:hypothetical protein